MKEMIISREHLKKLLFEHDIELVNKGKVSDPDYLNYKGVKVPIERHRNLDIYTLRMDDDLQKQFEDMLGYGTPQPEVRNTGGRELYCGCDKPEHEPRFFGTFKFTFCTNCKKEAEGANG